MTDSFKQPTNTGLNLPPGYRLAALATATVALAIYRLTLAPDLTWANAAYDGVELITASATFGIPHPPGYPTYVILGKLFSFLPLGTVAFRYNLFSAVTAAAAGGLSILVIGSLYPRVRLPAAISAALLFGFAPLVWSQAVVTEIYSLNLLLLAAFLLVWSQRGATSWAGFWLGLAITTHPTSVFMLPALVLSGRRQIKRPLVGLLAGLTPLLLLPLLAIGESPIVWGRPTDGAGLWWLVSGQLYKANFWPGIDLDHMSTLLQAILFGPMALRLLTHEVNGLNLSIETTNASESRPTTALLGGTAILYFAFALFYKTPDAAVLLLPAFLLTAIISAPLINRLGNAALLLPICLALLTFPARDISQINIARPLAESVLQAAPANAILLTPGDRTIFTLLYFQHIEGRRSDLRLVDANLFAFDWYRDRLATQYTDIFIPEGDDLASLQRENELTRRFCLVSFISPPGSFPDGQASFIDRSDTPPYLTCAEGLP